ncbi:MAG: hypothetical protein H6737_32120 [Alphaproteobacteria bacterium]|nr:hypothetical protein [Alphaproteobacteria bacterium]
MRSLTLAILLAGCVDPVVVPQRIAPADGQTDVGPNQPLVVVGDVGHFPEDYPLPELVEVVDLEVGGIVPGSIESVDGALVFTPDAPWADDREYVWTLRDPYDESRRPEFEIEPSLQGTAFFSTARELRVIHAAWSASDELCVLTSQPVLAFEVESRMRITLDDEPVPIAAFRILDDAELVQEDLADGDSGIGGVCLTVSARVGAASGRIFVDESAWLRELFHVEPADMVAAVRRGS